MGITIGTPGGNQKQVDGEIIRNETFIGDIPVLEAYLPGSEKKPLVILSHGFAGSKEKMNTFAFMDALTRRGCLAVALDNRLHGKRPGPGFKEMAIKAQGKVDVFEVRKAIKGTAEDISALIDHYSADERVDEGKVCVAGFSMGGFVTYRAVVTDARIKVAMPFISSPYWDDIPGDIPTVDEAEQMRDLTVYAAQYSPGNQPDKFYPCALLMQAGDDDNHFNVNRLRGFAKKLEELYAHEPERLKLVIYPGLKHEVTEEMIGTALGWMDQYL